MSEQYHGFERAGKSARLAGCCALLGALLASRGGADVNAGCDPYLRSAVDHPFAYQRVADRCEGIYLQDVSSSVLSVASLTESFEDYDLESDEPLRISWPAQPDGAVRVRVNSLKRRQYYRMDTQQAGDGSPYVWPHNLLVAMQIRREDIGLLAWVRRPVDGVDRSVFLPVGVSQGSSRPASGRYELVVVPGRDLEQLFIGIALLDERGKPATVVRDAEQLPHSFYPSHRGIHITVSDLPASGLYQLQLSALLRGGGAATLETWFLHPQ